MLDTGISDSNDLPISHHKSALEKKFEADSDEWLGVPTPPVQSVVFMFPLLAFGL